MIKQDLDENSIKALREKQFDKEVVGTFIK